MIQLLVVVNQYIIKVVYTYTFLLLYPSMKVGVKIPVLWDQYKIERKE